MYRGPQIGVFTTYGIVDPRTGHFVYIGQTSDFEKRKRAHLRGIDEGRRRPKIPRENIVTWTYGALTAGITPVVVILETVGTYEQSLISESEWVHRLAGENHPLLNRWKEHREAIKYGIATEPNRPRMLPEGVRRAAVARVEATPRWTDEELRIWKERKDARGDKGKPWTKTRDEALRELFRSGAGATQIARTIGRTKSAVRRRLMRLGMIAERDDLRD